MTITLDGTTGITTPGLTNTGTETIVNLTTTGNTTLGDATTDTLTVGVTGIVKDASGNVGIGTASPNGKLDVRAPNVVTDAIGQVSVYANDFGINYGGSIGLGGAYNTALTTFTDYTQIAGRKENSTSGDYAGYLSFATRVNGGGITERMRIDSSGNVGIGMTPTYKLDVTGSIRTSNTMYVLGGDGSIQRSGGNTWVFLSSNNGYNSNGYHLKLDASTTAGQCSFFTVGTETIRFDGSGNASKSSGAGSWLALSDKRIKENIAPVENGLERICLLKPSTFDYKQPNAHQGKTSDKGFIADDFAEVYPKSIVETDFIAEQDKQYFEEGALAKSMGFNAEFYADLVSAIQEQQALIQSLTTRITALEAK